MKSQCNSKYKSCDSDNKIAMKTKQRKPDTLTYE